ncbi:hypothetical protein, partial [Streptococcus pneumoniae]|uniref:hypothetical protein n=1 Tax=Streptococcus pneumoniae TaxID=1313 RepID=UPI0018B0D02C
PNILPDVRRNTEQVVKKIEEKLRVNPDNAGKMMFKPGPVNEPLVGLRENSIAPNLEPQQLSFSDVADTKGTAIDNVE